MFVLNVLVNEFFLFVGGPGVLPGSTFPDSDQRAALRRFHAKECPVSKRSLLGSSASALTLND